MERVYRHGGQGTLLPVKTVPDRANVIDIGVVASDSALTARQVGGIDPAHDRIVDEDLSGKVVAVTVHALADGGREVSAPLHRCRVGRYRNRGLSDLVLPRHPTRGDGVYDGQAHGDDCDQPAHQKSNPAQHTPHANSVTRG
jgi:hypothetical protein